MRQKQIPILVSIASFATCLSATARAQDGLGDVRALKPVLMLIVDTSGSMERLPAESLPSCTGVPASDATQKSRWTGTVEALTGSYINYACQRQDRSTYATTEYDFGYYLPHFAPVTGIAQAGDGVLDALRYSTKFGLMTFDGTGTHQGGAPLIPLTTVDTDDALEDLIGNGSPDATGAAYSGTAGGQYSYGQIKRVSFPGCETSYGVNLGARGPAPTGGPAFAGAMVSVSASDSPAALLVANNAVQESLRTVRPYGGTPTAAALDDLKYWLDHSPDVRSPADVFAACRPKYAMLITDGAPDPLFRDSRYTCAPPDGNKTGYDRDGLGGVTADELCAKNMPVTDVLIPGRTPTATELPLCECPYETEVSTTMSVVKNMATGPKTPSKLDQVFVVALNVTEPSALARLDLIAEAGNPGVTGTKAVRATSAAQLRAALSTTFGQVSGKATSRTIPITIDGSADTFSATAPSYEVRAGFRAIAAPELPWSGILERTVISCTGTAVNYADVAGTGDDQFHTRLNAQSAANQRNLYTVSEAPLGTARGTLRAVAGGAFTGAPSTTNNIGPNGTLMGTEPLAPDSTVVAATNAGQGLSAISQVIEPFDAGVDPLFFGDADQAAPLAAGQPGDRDRIVDYLKGKLFPNHTLADIYHSNPVALGPVVTSGVAPRLGAWRRELLATPDYRVPSRPKVVFVATNDGLLHAFNLAAWSGKPAGHEFWSFFPPALFDKVHASATASPTHQFMFDGDLVVKDLYLSGSQGSTLANTRTVLLAAVRGAPAYVALDVTNPEQPPRLLWQFSDVYMGDTVGRPVLAQASFKWSSGPVEERAIAILPGGLGEETTSTAGCARGPGGRSKATAPTTARDNGRCWKARGRTLYVVDVATGLLIQKFDHRHFPAPLSGSVAIDESRPVTRAGYFTDADGVLWRLSLESTKVDEWRVQPIWDVFHDGAVPDPQLWQKGRPSNYAPTITRDSAGSTVIIVGTGDIDNLTDPAAHRVVSLTEQRTVAGEVVTIGIGKTDQPVDAKKANWEIQLDARESVTGPLALLEGVVYFSTFTATISDDACELGSSKLWGAAYVKTASGGTLPEGRLVISDGPPPVFGLNVATENNAVVLGLSVGKDPLCLVGSADNNPFGNGVGFNATGGPTSSSFHIRANVGSMSGVGAPSSSNSSLGKYTKTMAVSRRSKVVGWAGSVE